MTCTSVLVCSSPSCSTWQNAGMASWPWTTWLQCQLGGNTMQGLGKALQEAVCNLNQHLIHGVVSPIVRIHRSSIQWVERGVTPLTIILVIHQQNFPSCHRKIMFCWPRNFNSKGKNASTGRNNDSIELDIKTTIWLLCTTHSFNQQAEKEVTALAGVINPNYQGEMGLLLTMELNQYVWNTGDLLGCLLVISRPVISQWKTTITKFRENY